MPEKSHAKNIIIQNNNYSKVMGPQLLINFLQKV